MASGDIGSSENDSSNAFILSSDTECELDVNDNSEYILFLKNFPT